MGAQRFAERPPQSIACGLTYPSGVLLVVVVPRPSGLLGSPSGARFALGSAITLHKALGSAEPDVTLSVAAAHTACDASRASAARTQAEYFRLLVRIGWSLHRFLQSSS